MTDEDARFLWLQHLAVQPGMIQIYKIYLTLERDSAQAEMDKAVDAADSIRAARAKGKRDAYDNLLHHVRSRAEGAA